MEMQLEQESHKEQVQQRSGSCTLETFIMMQEQEYLAIDGDDRWKPDVGNGNGTKSYKDMEHLTPLVGGVVLEFDELSYVVSRKLKKDGKRVSKQVNLLKGITGQATNGEVTAVIGPSGAGKSTLLDALAGRIAKGSLGGSVRVGGRQISTSGMKKISAYVMQDDQLFPMLTVYETLMFAAEVRLSPQMDVKEKRARVDRLMDLLGLQV